jgi:phage baseplate assembly protein gpV
MAANWVNPVTTSLYTDVLSILKERDLDAATQFNNGTATNIPTNAVRWDGTLNRWQRWNGTAWAELTSTYSLTGLTVTSLNNTGNTTLGDSSADSVTVNAATWAFANPVTITGSVTWSGAQTFSSTVTLNGAVSGNTSIWNIGSGQFYKDASGNFGLGNTSPGARLDVTGNIRLSASNPNIEFNNGGGMIYGPAANTLAFATGGGPGSPVERFRITSTGGITSADLADAVGYKGLPQNARTSAYTLALSDMGMHISITTGGVTIPANSAVAFPIGSTIVVFNNSGSAQTISINTDTLRLGGTATTGNRTIAQYGIATLVKVAATVWVATGNVT